MKKNFLIFCFMAVLSLTPNAQAQRQSSWDAPIPIMDTTIPEVLPDMSDTEAFLAFMKDRFSKANYSTNKSFTELNSGNTIDILHSKEYIEQLQNDDKSIFERIYEKALQSVDNKSTQTDSELDFYELMQPKTLSADNVAPLNTYQYPMVNVTLPSGRKVVAPAVEHIPYLLTSLHILPTGLVQVEEEMTVIANGKKLKNGLIKIMPKYSTSRAGVRKKIDVTLESVSINGQNVPHVLEEIGDNIYIKPQQPYNLPSGVYTYNFKYLVDRKLWYYDDFTEFYWNVTGSYLNLMIASANAVVSLPDGRQFMGQNVFIGSPKSLNPNRAIVAALDNNALGFASTTPLLPGEGMYILTTLHQDIFLKPDINQRFVWFISDFGDVLFALLGLIAILSSYILSANYLKKNKPKILGHFQISAPILRMLLKGAFDKTAFISAFLDIYQKGVIDIQKQENSVVLIKKTDDVHNLNLGEKKALAHLFGSHDSVISVQNSNTLKFKRAESALERHTRRTLKLLNFQLNIGYLFFGIAMLVLTEASIAFLSVNPAQTGIILFCFTAVVAFYFWILRIRFSHRLTNIFKIVICLSFILFAILLLSVYLRFVSALLLAAAIYAIWEYSSFFAQRTGLIKSKIKEAEALSQYLQAHASEINTTDAFFKQQAHIFAFDLLAFYPRTPQNAAVYKLDLAHLMEMLL